MSEPIFCPLATSYLSTNSYYAWTRVTMYSMLIGRGCGHETHKTMSWHMAALCVSCVTSVVTCDSVKL